MLPKTDPINTQTYVPSKPLQVGSKNFPRVKLSRVNPVMLLVSSPSFVLKWPQQPERLIVLPNMHVSYLAGKRERELVVGNHPPNQIP